ncbi:MAG: hypothetical protein IJ809_02325 [Clostridia bacterium]|nr:hypothetical protein [Clostridia bacterium]
MKNYGIKITQIKSSPLETVIYEGAMINDNITGIYYGTVKATHPDFVRKEICAVVGYKVKSREYKYVIYQLEGTLGLILPLEFTTDLKGNGTWKVLDVFAHDYDSSVEQVEGKGTITLESISSVKVKATKIYEIKNSDIAKSFTLSNILGISRRVSDMI